MLRIWIPEGDIAQDRDRRDQGLDAGIRGNVLLVGCPTRRVALTDVVQQCLERRLCVAKLLADVFRQRVGFHGFFGAR